MDSCPIPVESGSIPAESGGFLQEWEGHCKVLVICTHLCNEHLAPWVDGCEQFKIPIVAKTFKDHVDEYCKVNGGCSATQEDPTVPTHAYSHETFINTIVEQVVLCSGRSRNIFSTVIYLH